MAFLIGPMGKHLNGHKDLSMDKDPIELLNTDFVYIPIYCPRGPYTLLVKEGDEVKIGMKIAETNDDSKFPTYASCSGTVVGVEKRMCSNLRPGDHLKIANDKKDTMVDAKPFDWQNKTKEEVVDFMREIGLQGQGGAGFPTYIKYKANVETLLINAVECEPYITSDTKSILMYGESLKEGVKCLFKTSNAKKCYIVIKEDKLKAIDVLNKLFADEADINVFTCKNEYPMGGERMVVRSVLHKEFNMLPSEAGAIVSNVFTAIALGNALRTGIPNYKKLVTVSGEGVKNPCNVLARVGTCFKELVDACGGYTAEEVKLIGGGPMMGPTLTKDEVCTNTVSNAITVLKAEKKVERACLRCGRCAESCPLGLIPVDINNALKANDIDKLKKLDASRCMMCGVCSYVCPSKIEVTEGVKRAKTLLRMKG